MEQQARRFVPIVVVSIAVLICSCATLTLTDLGSLKKGMTLQETESITPTSPEHSWSILLEGDTEEVTLHHYIVSSGSATSDYILAFDHNGLLYWGYPHEFARSKDHRINRIGQIAVEKLDEVERARYSKSYGGRW